MDKNQILESFSKLLNKYELIKNNLNLNDKKAELEDLQDQINKDGFWDNVELAQRISKKASQIENFLKVWEKIRDSLENFLEFFEISEHEDLENLINEFEDIEKLFDQEEVKLLFTSEYDAGNALLSIHVGNGGQDAEDFCVMLERMYLRFAEQQNFKVNILEESFSEAGLRSALIEITGDFAYGFLKSEHGIQRLIRLSPFNAKSLRQTSFAKIEILPVIENDTDLELKNEDLRIDVFRSSGAGGQSVNTTDSAVRITYLPLNLIVTCQNEKSQQQNKASAMKVLKSGLLQLKIEQNSEKLEALRGEKMDANFGSQIRTFTLQPYKLVKDHRTNFEVGNPEKVLDGNLMPFIQSFLRNNI
jgi:peptide chain release factor 2